MKGFARVQEIRDPKLIMPRKAIFSIITYMEGGKPIQLYAGNLSIKCTDKRKGYMINNMIPECLLETLLAVRVSDRIKYYIKRIPYY
jgi:hypothetical protein